MKHTQKHKKLGSYVSALALSLSLLVALMVTGLLLFLHGKTVMEEQLRSKLMTIAAVASQKFNAADVEAVHSEDDMTTASFQRLVSQLQAIRAAMPEARYVYIMRRTEQPNHLEFVADADSLKTDDELDENGNGIVEEDEQASYPGDTYDVTGIPALESEAFLRPAVDAEITYDQWGSFISGYSPIVDASGRVIAILGIDMDATEFTVSARSAFSPVAVLLLALIGAVTGILIFVYTWKRRLEALHQIEQERRSMLELAMHQLGAPIATIRWWMEIMCEKHDCKTDEHNPCKEMGVAVKRMSEIVETLAQVASMDKESLIGKPLCVPACDLVTEAVALSEPYRLARRQTITESCTKNLTVCIDPKLMVGVLREFLENASEYSPSNSAVAITAKEDGRYALFCIEDQGCGIPKDELNQVFQKFHRGTNASKIKPVGNGIGIYIARKIVEQASGSVWVESEENKGSRFYVRLKRKA